MALKPDRNYNPADLVTYYSMFETGQRGGVVFQSTGFYPQGAGLDDGQQRCYYVNANTSGFKPVGLLCNDVVNLDLSRTHINFHKDETQVGQPVTVAKQGEFVTNYFGVGQASGASLTLPATVYAGPSGFLYTTAGYASSGWPAVGKVLSYVDSQGYARVRIDL
jgi:hypothetical protein